jgi:glycosyltransferase involved in cell wall biosynthesis
VTVAIPARNEDEQLIICLDSLISSDYPKLEILVLDDCSQSKRTSQIIRSYAQSGVTFIQGEAPKSNYLAKNFAYQELLEVANGQFILYAGVDVRFRSDSIRKIVEFILINKKNMISILPNTILPSRARLRVVLIQSLRYLWELGLPRRQFNKPPVLSTCWMINRQLLIHQGGFKGLRREIIPERTLASRISRIKDGYVFMKSGQYFGINSYKDFLAQYQTAIRVKYPSLKQRLELVMLVSIIEIVLFGGIIFDLLAAIFVPSWILLVWSIVIFGLINIVYFSLLKFLFNKYYYSALIYGSILLLVDVVLWNISMIKYEFSEVIWKNRNVCIPTMRLD